MLSLIDRYSDKKECHILWTTRDRHMVKHFNSMLRKCHSTVWFTNKDINAKQQFQELQHTLSSTLKADIETASVATASANSSAHGSTQDLNGIECGPTNMNDTGTATVNDSVNTVYGSERDRVTTDIVTLLEQGWPTHWNRLTAKTPTNGTCRRTTKQVISTT
jgi:hypothetical protein